MEQVFLNPAFNAISGRVGAVVFYSYDGKTFFRSYVRPHNPDTPAQRNNRGLFRNAMKSWQALSLFDKESYARRARRLCMTGHNLFISLYMASHRADAKIAAAGGSGAAHAGDFFAREIPARSSACRSVHGISHSVCGSGEGGFSGDIMSGHFRSLKYVLSNKDVPL